MSEYLNQRLRLARQGRGWSQQQLAELVGATPNTISRWELGCTRPSPHFRARLSAVFGLSLTELGLLPPNADQSPEPPVSNLDSQDTPLPSAAPSLPPWNVPFRRNLYFTGREEVLAHLHQRLSSGVPQALTGMGGIGKTHTAIEYAYRYRHAYQAVFWLRAETRDLLLADLAALAEALGLAEPTERDQQRLLKAVQTWLHTHPGWLVILDNVEDLLDIADLMPDPVVGGILLTTRTPVTGTVAQAIDLATLEPEEGALLLLRRAKHLGMQTQLTEAPLIEQSQARELAALFEGLPLALDQAGAYLEETGCRLGEYLDRYRTQRAALLARRGEKAKEHPASVMITFSLALEQLERQQPGAAALLHLCAFLLPDAIPLDFLMAGAAELDPPVCHLLSDSLALDTAITALRRAALIQRHPETDTFSLHRLVQVVLMERLDEPARRIWAARVLHAMTRLFPQTKVQVDYWQVAGRLLPHALACLALSEQWQTEIPERITLMNHVATYFFNRANFAEAEALYQRALHLGEQTLGTEDVLVAASMLGLANLAKDQGRYAEAEALYRRVVAIRTQALGADHPLLSSPLNNLALVYLNQARYQEAEHCFRQAAHICEHALGPDDPLLGTSLNNLAIVFMERGQYAEAEQLCWRSVHIAEQAVGPTHSQVALPLTNLAEIYQARGYYDQAAHFYQRAVQIQECALGPDHPGLAYTLNGMAGLHREQGAYDQADQLFRRALGIWEQRLGAEHPFTVCALQGMAQLAAEEGRYADAEGLYERAICVRQQTLGPTHPHTVQSRNGLARLYMAQGLDARAETLCHEVLALIEHAPVPAPLEAAESLATLACLARLQKNAEQGEHLWQRARTMCEQALGVDHQQRIARWERELQRLLERRQACTSGNKAARPGARPDSSKNRHGVLLSTREQEVLALLAEGKSNREIAQALVVEVSTVKWYLKILYSKLHVHSRTQAIIQAGAVLPVS